MHSSSVLIQPQFSKSAKALRQHFDRRFQNPHSSDGQRFVWDYWHVPGQYTVLRTPAYHFFPAPVYQKFHEELVLWGRRVLGCHDVSPPWLSNYVEGCRQEFHSDMPHGPWAFVFSLTPWKDRKFKGGETLLLKPEILNLWQNLDQFSGLEEDQILEKVNPEFNQLTVFDPRIPHAVRRVEGTHDPREGRLVIHGWFMQPRPFIEGPLSTQTLERSIEQLTEKIEPILREYPDLRGLLSIRFQVTPQGHVKNLKVLSNTLIATSGVKEGHARLLTCVKKTLSKISLKESKPLRSSSWVTLPLIFS